MAVKETHTNSDTHAPRRVWGVALLVLSVFVALSIFSYDWRDVERLHSPPNVPPCNLIGPVGAALAFGLFMFFGVAAYLAPLVLLADGLILVRGRDRRAWPRLLWVLVGVCGVALALELRPQFWYGACRSLNIADAGGVWGRLVAADLLIRWMNPMGAGILIGAMITISTVMAVRGDRILRWVAAVWTGARVAAARAQAARLARRRERANARAAAAPPPERGVPRAAAVTPPREDLELVEVPPQPQPPQPRRKPAAPPPRAAEPDSFAPEAPRAPGEPDGTAPTSFSTYQFPTIDLLDPVPLSTGDEAPPDTVAIGQTLVNTLADFGIEVTFVNAEIGPVVTCYEVLPAPGVKVERIVSLQNNLALSLKAISVRVQAPIPGKGVVGIEVPNPTAKTVYLREIMEGEKWKRGNIRLPLALGKDVGGNDIIADLTRMPHMLIAGATG